MLNIILGRSGSGKSEHLLRRIKAEGALRTQILLVPEQSSHESELRLCALCGSGASSYAEVFSFTSLAERVAALYGGLAAPMLDDGGRLLLMYRSLHALAGSLALFGPSAQKPEFLTQLLSTLDELKSACVTPAQLHEIADITEGLREKKLRDLALIYEGYNTLSAQVAADPRDRLTRLGEQLHSEDFCCGRDFYFDGFVDFTPQEEAVITAILKKANSLSIAFSCDALDSNGDTEGVFANARESALALCHLAERLGCKVKVETLTLSEGARPAALSHLEAALFCDGAPVCSEEGREELRVCSLPSRRDELHWAAAEIRALLRRGDLRCRDIALAARDFSVYEDWVDGIFSRYHIPLFHASMQPIVQKPVFTLLLSALDVLSGNFAFEDVFRYLKSGLSGISPSDCDLLENYVSLWRIRGREWTCEAGFTRSPSGFGLGESTEDEEKLKDLNRIRCKVITPYISFRNNMAVSAQSKVIALYSFMEEIQLAEQLEARSEALLSRGEPELAEEYRQLWDILCRALEQCASILGEQAIELDEFARLLRLLFSQYTVGSIPASLDRIVTGSLPRLANRHVKVLFVLGAEEGAIPQLLPRAGLLNEEDCALFSDYGIRLSPGLEAQQKREWNILYTACAQPTQQLFVSWPQQAQGGKEYFPSMLITRLRALFPACYDTLTAEDLRSEDPTVLLLAAAADSELRLRLHEDARFSAFATRADSAAAWRRGRLTPDSVEKLYSKRPSFSASRLDRYQNCKFAYFLQYGLRAKPRRKADFAAPEYGNFVHYVLEQVLRDRKSALEGASNFTLQMDASISSAISRYLHEQLGGMEAQTPRFRYLFARLRKTVRLVVENVISELDNSDFQPLFFELGFGRDSDLPPISLHEGELNLQISGFIDRVDGWLRDGKLYLKVVDYKTGRKAFDFTDVLNGIGLQMLLYLFALEEHPQLFGATELVPAGLLYLPARDVLLDGSRAMPESERRKRMDKELKRQGLLLDDPTVLEALEQPNEGGPRFLPLRVSAKTGKITGDALVSAEQLGRLRRHIFTVLHGLCQELAAGTVSAEPYWRGPAQNACLYCDYAAACHFDERNGEDRRRWAGSLNSKQFWEKLLQEEEEA